MSDILISARNIMLHKDAEQTVPPVDLDIVSGSIYGFIGPDNSQISRWLQTLAAIDPPESGRVQFLGSNTSNLDRNSWQSMRNNIAYLNSRTALLSVLSTRENILLPALYHKLALRETLEKQMLSLLEQIGFSDTSNLTKLPAYLDELSYTQAILVRVALTNPRVIIIDDTLRHFDERTARKLLEFIKSYVAKSGAALLLQDDNAEFVLKNTTNIVYIDIRSLHQFKSLIDLQASNDEHVLQYLHELRPISS